MSGYRSEISVLLGIILAILGLFSFGGEKTEFEDLALGEDVSIVYGSDEYGRYHIRGSQEEFAQYLGTWQQRGSSELVLWLGNSHLHSVLNNRSSAHTHNCETGPNWLFGSLRSRSIGLMAVSPPNCNIEEQYIVFEYLRAKTHVKFLCIGICFADLRVGGIRSDLQCLLSDLELAQSLEKSEAGKGILAKTVSDSDGQGEDFAGVANTPQEKVELYLEEVLSKRSQLWQNRPEARGQIFRWLRRARNFAFLVDATTKRSIVRSHYVANMAALKAIIADASESDISVMVYITPIRQGQPLIYNEDEYSKFKDEVKELLNKYDAYFANLEALIPDEHWNRPEENETGDEFVFDYKHFDREGHRLIAQEVCNWLAVECVCQIK